MSGSIGLGTVDYLYTPGSGKASVFHSVDGRLQTDGMSQAFQWKVNAEGLAIVRPQATYTFEAPEIYIGTSPLLSQVVQFKVGRELHHWNHLDETFELGIWQPRLRWDYVRPEAVGLAGAFLDVDLPGLQLTIMGSPGFVPDRGVPEEFRNGGIYSESPYFVSPATTVSFRDVPTSVDYSLSAPSTVSILSHGAVSAMARVGQPEGAWASFSYAYKPINQILFSYNADLLSDGTNNPGAQATIYPRIAYESLISSEAGYESPHFGAWVSGLHDRPNDNQSISGSTWQTLTPAHAISVATEARFGELKYDPTRIQLAALRIWGGNSPDQGTYASGTGSIFDARYPYQTAGVFEVKSSFKWIGLSDLHARYKLLYDFSHFGNIQSTDFDYRIRKSIVVSVGTDILTSHEDQSATDDISRYRANDRVRFGVSYVF
jgi:hypothetical protein